MILIPGYGDPDLGRILVGKAARKAQAPASGGRIEAETMTIVQGWSVKASGVASNGQWLQGGAAGALCIAQMTHALGNGTYNITVAHFDESDGQSTSEIRVNGVVIDSWVWNVDADLGTGNASAASQVNRTIPNVTLANGDTIELRGTAHAAEAMRVDYFDFALV